MTVPATRRELAQSAIAVLRENDRGKFLRITEEAHGRRNTIIVPSTGVDDFTKAIADVLAASGSSANS